MADGSGVKPLVDALAKFIEWQREYDDIKQERFDRRDSAERLGLLLYGKDDSSKLIGGSDCPIFNDAAQAIESAQMAARHCADALMNLDGMLYMNAVAMWPWLSEKGGVKL